MAHQLSTAQFVSRPIEEVFAFFSDARNLGRITPSSMSFEFLSEDFEMREGLRIDYRLRPLFGVPTKWRTLISDYQPPREFTDIQEVGPYKSWHHHHTFEAVDGGTLVRDQVEYELPLGPLGSVGNALLVRGELEKVFRYRARIIERVFAGAAPNQAPFNVAVAGGTGFVGGAIARELHARGEKVVVLTHRGEEARGGLPDDIDIRRADVTARGAQLTNALLGIDTLVIALAFK